MGLPGPIELLFLAVIGFFFVGAILALVVFVTRRNQK